MIATNPIPDVCNYAQCGEKCAPTPEQAAAGLVPLATIPAQRWNSLWNAANQSVNCLKSAAGALIDEINSVLTATGITPDPTCTDQLYQAIDCIRNALGTDQVAGSVKSSSVAGQVSIDANGIMTANCVGNATQLTTSCKELTGAVNELKTTYDNAFTHVWGNATWVTDCRADNCHSSDALTYGGGTSTLYGHVKLSDTYDSCVGNAASSVAASQLTLYCLMQAVENMSGLSNCAACPISVTQSGAAGTSPQAARSDHVHYLNTNAYFPYTIAGATGCYSSASLVDNVGYEPYVSQCCLSQYGGLADFAGYLWQGYSSGWFQTIYCPVDYFKGYFRGCNINDHLRDWLMVGCCVSSPSGAYFCTSQSYCCWCCLMCQFGIDVQTVLDRHSLATYFSGDSYYPYYVGSIMGTRYVRYSNNPYVIDPWSNARCCVTTGAMVDGGLHLLTAAFRVRLCNGVIPINSRAHALVELTNDARIPTGLGEGGCAYLQSFGTIYSFWCGAGADADISCIRKATQDVSYLLNYTGGCYYYGYDASYIVYGLTTNYFNIGVKNQTLYMRNA